MKFEKEEDRLNFVIELLNHPELLQEVRVQEWLAEPRNKDLYEECRRYLEGGLRLTVGDQLDVEGEYRNFTRKMKSGGRSRRMIWFSVAAAVVILISASSCGRTHCTRKESSRVDHGIRRGTCFECIRV